MQLNDDLKRCIAASLDANGAERVLLISMLLEASLKRGDLQMQYIPGGIPTEEIYKKLDLDKDEEANKLRQELQKANELADQRLAQVNEALKQWNIPKRGDKVRIVKFPEFNHGCSTAGKVGDIITVGGIGSSMYIGQTNPDWLEISYPCIFWALPKKEGEPSPVYESLPLECVEPV